MTVRVRIATARPLRALCAVAASGALVLTGCGSDDSTVSGSPTETMAPPPSPTGTRTAPAESGGDDRYPEYAEPVESDAPGYTAPVVGPRERGYLAALEARDVETEEMSDPLVAAGNTICTIRSTGGAADETTTIADAVAGQLVEGGYSDLPEEELSGLIVDSAAAQLCP